MTSVVNQTIFPKLLSTINSASSIFAPVLSHPMELSRDDITRGVEDLVSDVLNDVFDFLLRSSGVSPSEFHDFHSQLDHPFVFISRSLNCLLKYFMNMS